MPLKGVPAQPARRLKLSGPPRSGGPERKLRGRPPSPVEPRSGPWRRTGSESGAGRARTRRTLSLQREKRGDDRATRKLAARDLQEFPQSTMYGGLRRWRAALERELAKGKRRV